MKKVVSFCLSLLMTVSVLTVYPEETKSANVYGDEYYGMFDFTDNSCIRVGEPLDGDLIFNDRSLRYDVASADAVVWTDCTTNKTGIANLDSSVKAVAGHSYKVRYRIKSRDNIEFTEIDGVTVNGVDCDWTVGGSGAVLYVTVNYVYVETRNCTARTKNNYFIPGEEVTFLSSIGKTEDQHAIWCYVGEVVDEETGGTGHEVYDREVVTDGTDWKFTTKIKGESATERVYPTYSAHKAEEDAAIKPTCTAEGKSAGSHCKVCGINLSGNEVIKPTGHSYQSVLTPAAIGQNGQNITKCITCGNVSEEKVITGVADVKLTQEHFTYNGKVQKPAVVVTDSKGTALVNGTDYTVAYSGDCKSVGKYTAVVTLKGNYSGTKSCAFDIAPKKMNIAKVTAGRKGFKVSWKKQTTQISGYEIQYSTDKRFKKAVKTVTIKKNKITSKSVSKLKAKKKYYVRIRTYKMCDQTKLVSDWSKVKTVTTKK